MNKKPNISFSNIVLLLAILALLIAIGLVAYKFMTKESPTTNTVGKSQGAATSKIAIDPSHIPIGDGKVSTTEPKKGYVYSCTDDFRTSGAEHLGPWASNGYWDSTTKPMVDGNINWPNANFTITKNNTTRTIRGNNLPVSHNTGIYPTAKTDDAYSYDRNPNSILSQPIIASLPSVPKLAANPGCIRGPVGYMVSGVAIYSALDAAGRDAAAHEVQDLCDGHPHRGGVYHYHNLSRCVDDNNDKEKLLGYALDGFGIFSLRDSDGNELTNDSLDECHGHTHQTQWDAEIKDIYHYHLTREYPYSVGCYRGTATQSSLRN